MGYVPPMAAKADRPNADSKWFVGCGSLVEASNGPYDGLMDCDVNCNEDVDEDEGEEENEETLTTVVDELPEVTVTEVRAAGCAAPVNLNIC